MLNTTVFIKQYIKCSRMSSLQQCMLLTPFMYFSLGWNNFSVAALTTSLVLKLVSTGGTTARVEDGEERWDDDGYKIQVITGNSADTTSKASLQSKSKQFLSRYVYPLSRIRRKCVSTVVSFKLSKHGIQKSVSLWYFSDPGWIQNTCVTKIPSNKVYARYIIRKMEELPCSHIYYEKLDSIQSYKWERVCVCLCVCICVYSCIFYAPRYVVSVACLALSHERHDFWQNSE
jgi:hypothetical protein